MKQIVLCLSSLICMGSLIISCKEPDFVNETPVDNFKAKSNSEFRLDFPGNMVGIDWSQQSSNNFYYWTGNGTTRFGTYNDTDPISTYTYTYTNGGLATIDRYTSQIAEMGIGLEPGTSVNRVYTYFFDNTFVEGISNDLDYYAGHVAFTCDPAHTASDIVGIAISSRNYTYAWYKDGTVSYGTKANLGSISGPYAYSLPPGKTYIDIVGMAIDRANSDKVYTWYADGTVSIGVSNDLDYYAAPVAFD